MILAEFGTGQALWTMFYLFLFLIWFWLLIAIFGDIFRDDELSGGGKAFWSVFIIVLPYLGIFVYLIARGHGMGQRSAAAAQAQQAQFDQYVREAAGTSGPADQIAQAKALLDQGAISQQEFDALKAKALGS